MKFESPIIKTALSAQSEDPWLKVLVYGESGSGKTSWAARSPRPLIISLEEQGIASIAQSNPDALVVGCDSAEMFNTIWGAILKGKKSEIEGQPSLRVTLGDQSVDVQTIVIDSFTELTQMFHDHEKGGAKNLKIDQWGVIKHQGMQVLKQITALKCNVVLIARASTISDEGYNVVSPITTPKSISNDIGGHFNIVIRAGRKQGKVGIAHYLRMNGTDKVQGKSYGDIPSALWVTKDPGRTTLGSISLYTIGENAPHSKHDDAKWVTAGPPTAEEVGTDGLDKFEEPETEDIFS